MAWSGDPLSRPAEVYSVIHATPAIQQEALVLASNAAVVWLDRDVRTSTADIAAVLCEQVGVLPADITVVYHYPEAFLVRFMHPHHCAEAVRRDSIPSGTNNIQIMGWRLEAHAENVDLVHHVRLCLEGLPLHAWDMHAITTAIGTACSVDYIEQASVLKTETKVLALWAWTSCPSKVPRVNWVTLPTRNGGAPMCGRKGLEHRVLVHLAIHEDPSSVPEARNWRVGIVDGETRPVGCRNRDDDHDRRRDP